MTTFKITLEIKTSKWKKFLRFFKIIKQREEFELIFYDDFYEIGDIINTGMHEFLIIKKEQFKNNNEIRNRLKTFNFF